MNSLYANRLDSLQEVDKFLETYSCQDSQEEIDSLNRRPFTRREVEFLKKEIWYVLNVIRDWIKDIHKGSLLQEI